MRERTCLAIVLAAGEGTRMKSAKPKVLHEMAGLPLVCHAARAAQAGGRAELAIVAGRQSDDVLKAATTVAPSARLYLQHERLGTAHAVLAAREAIAEGYDDILVLFADTPLIESDDIAALRKGLADGASVVVMGFEAADPSGYGRLLMNGGQLVAIREDKDCSDEERKITFCNGGLMAIAGEHALSLIEAVGNANSKGEYYLTDIVEIAAARDLKVVATVADEESVLGVNNRVQLAEAEAVWQKRKRREMMLSGVTLVAPETVHFSHDTQIGADTIIEPNVVFGPGVKIASDAVIHSFSHIEGAEIESGAQIGPFARLRPGARLAEKAKVGNFCEVKNADVAAGAKINHLTYIGDATIGAGANIGAGTITCNYDGFLKHRTNIGAGAFIGSNSSLVAPVTIGDGGYVASGSVITQDVPADALAFGRARQVNKDGLGAQLRATLKAEKENRKAGGSK
ncbi:bifunctional UDP-N-acetylglucosamine diphosphorylase/glucosamine-1-phosphate N-acetyltransferase GlmU [Aliihoeflea sp. PC F10.4]